MELDQEGGGGIFYEMETRKIVDIASHDDDFQFIAQIIYVSDPLKKEDGGSITKYLMRDETSLIYGYLYDDHNLSLEALSLLQAQKYVRITIPESDGWSYNPSNSVARCNRNFCAKPDCVIINLRNGDEIGAAPPGFKIESEDNVHIPFKFTPFSEIENLEHSKVVDVLGVVRQIHWENDDDIAGLWGLGEQKTPFRQFEMIDIFPHNLPELELSGGRVPICLRVTVWGDQYRKVNTVGTIVALKGAKVSAGWGPRNGLSIGNTCEIFSVNGDDEMWIIPDDMQDFYWNLFPRLASPPRSPTENGSGAKRMKYEEVDLSLENSTTAGPSSRARRDGVVDFTKDMDPLIINVVKAARFLDETDQAGESVYRMRSNPRGLVLIINNVYFKNRPTEQHRKGSFHDERYMIQLFEGMGFQSDVNVNIRLDQFASVLSKFKSRLQNNNVDCVAVVVMSHGEHNVISLADDNLINVWKDVVYPFRDSECPWLAGKPKLFIFQYCQDSSSHQIVGRNSGTPYSMKDTLLCFPTLPGTTAVRDKFLGSHFIYCLAKVVMEHAADKDFVSILHEVQEYFSHEAIRLEEDARQCYWIQLGFKKRLFFNPGLFEED